LRSIIEELRGRLDFEVIAVDNYCPELHEQKKTVKIRKSKEDEKIEETESFQFPDRGGEIIEGSQRANHGLLKYAKYDKKLSHWNAKNVGIAKSHGEFLYFVDAHVVPSRSGIYDMFRHWAAHREAMNGTINLALTYKILDTKRLIYKLAIEDDGTVHYKFTPLREGKGLVLEVPCMSACGVLMHRSIIDKLGGGWPGLLGIYGGGENFMNFTLRTMGIRSYIFQRGTLHHHGDPREYYWNWTDYTGNRAVANYFIGGDRYLNQYLDHRKGDKATLEKIKSIVVQECSAQAEEVWSRQVISIQTWVETAIAEKWLDDKRMIDIFRKFL